MKMQLQDMEKTKFMHENVWYTTCWSKENHIDEFHILENYVVTGAPSPFLTGPQTE
jgi:hypothetical protein